MHKRKPDTTLIVDISNILFRVAAAQKAKFGSYDAADPEDLVGLCMHISLLSIAKWYNKFRPDFVVFTFEGGDNWRKAYTKENTTIRRQYKGNRVVDPDMAHFYELIDSFKETMSKYTSICCLCVPKMEADDLIGAYCQLTEGTGENVIILSGDRDFTQLLKMPHVKLVEPDKGKFRNTPDDKEYQPNIDYWLFLKCVRGDSGDNVPSAFPRVRETKIKEAFEDPYKRINFMNERWVDENAVEHRVGDLFEHNTVLMDLTAQPDHLRVELIEAVAEQVGNLGIYSHFHFLRFLGKYKLGEVAKGLNVFIELLANNQRFMNGSKGRSAETKAPTSEHAEAKPIAGLVF